MYSILYFFSATEGGFSSKRRFSIHGITKERGVIIQKEYDRFITRLLRDTSNLTAHLFLWGFPEIVARYVKSLPKNMELVAWLTWYYKNNPSKIRGWRSSQNACLHLSKPKERMYPEHFMDDK